MNQPRGFAFVDMDSDESAHNAIMALNESEFRGRQISVSLSTPRDGARAGGKMVNRGNAGRQGGTFSRGERGRSGPVPPARGGGSTRSSSHGVDPVSGICRYFLQGNCTYGSKCGFSHGNAQGGGRFDDGSLSNPGRVGIRGGMRGGGGGGMRGGGSFWNGNQGNMGTPGIYGGGMGPMGPMGNFGGMGGGSYGMQGQGNYGGMGQGNFGGMQLPSNFGLPANFLNQGNLAALGNLLGTNFGSGGQGNWGGPGQGSQQGGYGGSGGNWSTGQF